ncbi:hypothetical protein CROQUDRAFT_102878 [Cronartium quercuum f. sp. fusiforme G11]|uniref:Uncharacterized protein n=1 Tax=Cronartium quercuum f. sp. fusiforme G11 TaxID=708437 RepID=A0A9P6NS09_9BASI|nr:hypothetical protein CROQUDRAFT_102878 [Cronartium quercuum f. sp. fusiforme G11]
MGSGSSGLFCGLVMLCGLGSSLVKTAEDALAHRRALSLVSLRSNLAIVLLNAHTLSSAPLLVNNLCAYRILSRPHRTPFLTNPSLTHALTRRESSNPMEDVPPDISPGNICEQDVLMDNQDAPEITPRDPRRRDPSLFVFYDLY